MKHTHGEWVYDRAADKRSDGYIRMAESPEGTLAICKVMSRPEKEENARLIAAAPEMLAFLKYLTRDCDQSNPDSYDCDKLTALTIIAKAEGKS